MATLELSTPTFEIEMKMKINNEHVQIHHILSKIKVKFQPNSHTSQQVRNVVIGLHRVRIARQHVDMLKCWKMFR